MGIEELSGTLRDHTTLHVGGGAQQIVRVTTDQELIDLVRNIDQQGEQLWAKPTNLRSECRRLSPQLEKLEPTQHVYSR